MTTKEKMKTKHVAKTSANPATAKTVAAAPAPAAKRLSKPASKTSAETPLAASLKATKAAKPKKAKVVRDSFTMPEQDYAKLAELKKKCLKAGVHVKKSELLRAGVLGLAMLPDAALLKAVEQLDKTKTGRPAKA